MSISTVPLARGDDQLLQTTVACAYHIFLVALEARTWNTPFT